jgi:hypothetical protein
MKKWIAAALALPLSCLHAQTLVNSFEDIQFWTGSGTNRAAFILHFGDGQSPASVAWGYRWNGTNSVAAMVLALAGQTTGSNVPAPIAGSDGRLALAAVYYAFFGDYLVDSFTFAQSTLPPPWTQTTRILKDTYFEDELYPGLFVLPGAGGLWTGQNFNPAAVGMATLRMTNGGWYAFAKTATSDVPLALNQPVAVPAIATPLPIPDVTIRLTNGSAVIAVASQTGYSYQLAYSGSPAGVWTNQSPVVSGMDGLVLAFTNTLPGGIAATAQRFYRVIVSE